MQEQTQSQVFQREGDPYIYLYAKNQWYCYNPNEDPLGSGAMGTVFLGFSCSTRERIAVKRVKDEYANNRMIRERARQEASMSSFSHPNLVQMIGMCEVEPDRGPIFILSSFVSGITLEKHVKDQLNLLPDADRISKLSIEMCNVLDALHYLHSKGIVHRDVKPSNIMLEDGKTVKLMDLGIARMNGGNKYSSYGFIGTPQYSAPEQILREKEHMELTARTDIYALGVTFYELLTGVNPYSTEMENDVLLRQVTKPLPSHKKIPSSLFKVLRKATEKDPNKRYASALEFKTAIIAAIAEPPARSWRIIALYVVTAIIFILIIIFIFTY